jgi:hypothetical protein
MREHPEAMGHLIRPQLGYLGAMGYPRLLSRIVSS